MFLDLLFPRRCLGCGQWGSYFCPKCLERIKPFEKQVCPVCEKPAISGKTHARCQRKHAFDGLTSVFPYKGAIKEAITQLKYRFVTDLAEELIALSAKHLSLLTKSNISHLTPNISNILIPVPLHPRRQRWRGFNQAELLGKMLAEKFAWQVRTDILLRHKHTKPQTKLKGEKRKENIRGAFKIAPNIFISKKSRAAGISQYPNILIFDDVWTTGSTLKECGKVLKKTKARQVWGLTLAR